MVGWLQMQRQKHSVGNSWLKEFTRKSNEYVYLIDFEYQEVFSIDINLMHSNDKDYDLVYRDNMLMYMDDFKKKNKVIFKYYDIYTYEFIDEVVVGDS